MPVTQDKPMITHARQGHRNLPNMVPNRHEAGETGSAERHWLYLLRGFGDGRGGENPGKSTIPSHFSRMVAVSSIPKIRCSSSQELSKNDNDYIGPRSKPHQNGRN